MTWRWIKTAALCLAVCSCAMACNACEDSSPTRPAPKMSCADGVQNQGEQGVDCGGPCARPCEAPATCVDDIKNQGEEDVDCGGPCPACQAAPTCFDGIQNQGEQGVDCGGPCSACQAAPTCVDGILNQGEQGVDCGGPCPACQRQPTCTDGVQNQGETGVDCGGPCPACVAAPTCVDGIQNQGELGVDCGGPCPACMAAPTCVDGVQNQGELGVDCGGPCPACDVVPMPTCVDGVQNQGEQGVDCGGPCPACQEMPTCSDGVRNQGEEGVDCGGPCAACISPATCTDDIKNGDEEGADCGGSCPNTCFEKLAGGFRTGCAIDSVGDVYCWGLNFWGQGGAPNTFHSLVLPTKVSGVQGATHIATSGYHACAIVQGGAVKCWGWNINGQLGNGTNNDSSVGIQVPGIANANSLGMRTSLTCVTSQGQLYCWGAGVGNTPVRMAPSVSNASKIANVSGQACYLTSTKKVFCWGSNANKGLGREDTTFSTPNTAPVEITSLSNVDDVQSGGGFSCAKLQGGELRCWGLNASGQLGDGTTVDRATPQPVSSLGPVKDFWVSWAHTCALTTADETKCWGSGTWNTLGSGPRQDRLFPGTLSLGSTTHAMATGSLRHSCGLDAERRLFCWGNAAEGAAADGVDNIRTPRLVANLAPASQLSIGGISSCAVVTGGQLRCWGWNDKSAITTSEPFDQSSPTFIAGVSNPRAIATHYYYTCAVLSNGTTACTNSNSAGALVINQANMGVQDVTIGEYHFCYLKQNKTVWCEGRNSSGQAGLSPVSSGRTLGQVQGLSGPAAQVKAGLRFTCALLESGHVECWGENNRGQLGHGSAALNSPTPVRVTGVSNTAAIGVGHSHACAVDAQGVVKCWGANDQGQLGDGTSQDRRTPVIVAGISAQRLAAGEYHTCALAQDQSVRCWGNNSMGQLGDGTQSPSSTPKPVMGLSQVIDLGAGFGHTCARRQDGAVYCWGLGVHGQVGDGRVMYYATPNRAKR